MGLFVYRLFGAAVLDAGMYENIEADRTTTVQALATVVLSSIAAGVGAGDLFGNRLTTCLVVSAIAVLTWAAWAMLVFQIGTRVLPEPETHATWGELLRTTGFAAAPGVFQVFAIFPGARLPIFAASAIWMFAAMVVGVRHALDYRSTKRAIAVCALAAGLAVALAASASLWLASTVS
jgi:hypothetical protein